MERGRRPCPTFRLGHWEVEIRLRNLVFLMYIRRLTHLLKLEQPPVRLCLRTDTAALLERFSDAV